MWLSPMVAGVFLTVLALVGLLFNGYILLVLLITKQIHSANNVLLVHLGAVNLIICALSLFLCTPSYVRGAWVAGHALCQIQGFLFTWLHGASLWTICGLSCDRYCAIATPLHYTTRASPKKSLFFLAATGSLGAALALPPLIIPSHIIPFTFHRAFGGCSPQPAFAQGQASAISYSSFYATLSLFLPSLLIMICNFKILMIARYHQHRIISAIYEVTLSAQATITHQRNPFYLNKFRGRSAWLTIIQLLGSVFAMYWPYYAMVVWEAASKTEVPDSYSSAAFLLLGCSPPINAFVYGVKSKVLRKTFQNYLRKQVSKSEVQQEIQARTPSNHGSRRQSLTPLAGLLSKPPHPPLLRQLSENLVLPRALGPKPKLQRIASEFMGWRLSGNSATAAYVPAGVLAANFKLANFDLNSYIPPKTNTNKLVKDSVTLVVNSSVDATNSIINSCNNRNIERHSSTLCVPNSEDRSSTDSSVSVGGSDHKFRKKQRRRTKKTCRFYQSSSTDASSTETVATLSFGRMRSGFSFQDLYQALKPNSTKPKPEKLLPVSSSPNIIITKIMTSSSSSSDEDELNDRFITNNTCTKNSTRNISSIRIVSFKTDSMPDNSVTTVIDDAKDSTTSQIGEIIDNCVKEQKEVVRKCVSSDDPSDTVCRNSKLKTSPIGGNSSTEEDTSVKPENCTTLKQSIAKVTENINTKLQRHISLNNGVQKESDEFREVTQF